MYIRDGEDIPYVKPWSPISLQVISPGICLISPEAKKTDYAVAVMGVAQTALRDIIGRTNLSEVLSDRAALDKAMTEVLDRQTEPKCNRCKCGISRSRMPCKMP